MPTLYNCLLGSGSERNPFKLTSVLGDSGLQLQEIVSMIYVQAALDLEAKHATGMYLSLPNDFPEAWLQSPSSCLTSFTDPVLPATDSFTLNLITSKMQRDVAKAFTRFGFTHVNEHIITMDQLARNYGIRVPTKPMGVLAIDIAHVEDKIAIEVDGPTHYISIIDDEPDDTSNAGHAKFMQDKQEALIGRQCINGSTALKERLLRGLGWQVLHVPYWERYHLASDPAQEEAYCGLPLGNSEAVRAIAVR
jgi:hypothetical protein